MNLQPLPLTDYDQKKGEFIGSEQLLWQIRLYC